MKNIIALTVGDAGGVGPEISVKVSCDKLLRSMCTLVLIGAEQVIRRAAAKFSPDVEVVCYKDESSLQSENTCIYYCDFDVLAINESFVIGESSASAGELAYNAVKLAAEAVCRKEFDAIVTAPVSKESVNLAGIKFQGHTELVAEISGVDDFCMMQSDGPLRVVFATCHIPLMEVNTHLTKERVVKTIELLDAAPVADGVENPRIAIAGVNPHAGEAGYMGREEIETIIPAMEEARRLGIETEGPFPADTLFIERIRTQFDGIVAMYHDQGHIPFKMLAFDRGVNSTLGLPIIRTSVDHGTAFNIAWQGKADTGSLIAAVQIANNRINKRRQV
ncbi:MAG: 4-hydroxythreonine-4-phosphate dehydrogenase PdxA [Lentisphaeraceae bacterium]|nr:4-hydroxythreonine-4-phosphate dehydrogenase PdxA [Lentisphaeraceae bacterium]